MKNMLLAMDAVTISLIVIACIIGILYVGAVAIYSRYRWLEFSYRYKKAEIDVPGGDFARMVLDNYGLVDVEVKKGFSNRYIKRSNKIVLSYRVFRRKCISSYAIVMQLCTIAVMTAKEDKRVPRFEQISSLGTVSALLIFGGLISTIVYFAGSSGFGLIAIVLLAIAVILYILSLVFSIMNIKNQKVVNAEIENMVNTLNVFNEEDAKRILKFNKVFLKYRIIESLLSFFYTMYFILKIIGLLIKAGGKK